MPGRLRPGTEWSTYHDELATAFSLTIDTAGPNFGTDHVLDTIAATPTLATLTGTFRMRTIVSSERHRGHGARGSAA